MEKTSLRQSIYWTPEVLARMDEELEKRKLSRSEFVRACIVFVLDHKFVDQALKNGGKNADPS